MDKIELLERLAAIRKEAYENGRFRIQRQIERLMADIVDELPDNEETDLELKDHLNQTEFRLS